jgi:polyhydroxybutyrate depolymerase
MTFTAIVATVLICPVFMFGPAILYLWLIDSYGFNACTLSSAGLLFITGVFFLYRFLPLFHWIAMDGDTTRGKRFWTRQVVESHIVSGHPLTVLVGKAKIRDLRLAINSGAMIQTARFDLQRGPGPRFLPYVVFSLFLAACSAPSSSPPPPPPRSVISLSIDSTARSYILRIPPAYDGTTKLPLVILLHGATDSAAYAEEAYHFVEKSTAEHFLLVLPDALGESHAWHGFSPNTPDAPNNDLLFLSTLLDTLPKTYAIDPHRLYVCGHSSGAMMAYRLAAERPDAIAAVGIVAGTVGDNAYDPPLTIPPPRAPMPLILFHGKLDPTLPYDGQPDGIFSVAASVHFWCKPNHCPTAPTETAMILPTVRRDIYASPLHADIVLYTLLDGNHMWPGGKAMPGKTQQPVQDISATDLMWTFFTQHKKP